VPSLPLGAPVSACKHVLFGRVRDLLQRDLLEQSVTSGSRSRVRSGPALARNLLGNVMSGSSGSAIVLHNVTLAYDYHPAVHL
jgi:hypothetical protein